MNKTLSVAVPSVTVAAALIISVFASFAFSGISEKQEYEEILSYFQSILPTAESYSSTEDGGYTVLADGETYFFADVTVQGENGGEARVIVGVNVEGSVVGVNIIYSNGMELMDAEVAAISDAALILNIISTDDNIIVIEPAVSSGDENTDETTSDETQNSDDTGGVDDTETDKQTDTTAFYTDETGEEIKISDPKATSAETEDTAIVTSPNTETTEEDTSEESTGEESTEESTDEVTEETTTIAPDETTAAPDETTTTNASGTETTPEPVEETTVSTPEETTTAAEKTTADVAEETTTNSSESEVTSESGEDIGE